ncbi:MULTISPECIES: hypothetical protein [unclassified Bradyrhizobium]|uniref:hypothetical protein n=1 Tax=unclassified Bradyrhizobium TaxID=2631580 RepID=UPI0028E33E99|nr:MULTISPECIES: hypothetical protein [unclassified Bradyrhizobium]
MKRTKRQQKIDADRIQRAITGMIISMMAIPRIYAHAEKLIAEGATDEQLKASIRQLVGEPA